MAWRDLARLNKALQGLDFFADGATGVPSNSSLLSMSKMFPCLPILPTSLESLQQFFAFRWDGTGVLLRPLSLTPWLHLPYGLGRGFAAPARSTSRSASSGSGPQSPLDRTSSGLRPSLLWTACLMVGLSLQVCLVLFPSSLSLFSFSPTDVLA